MVAFYRKMCSFDKIVSSSTITGLRLISSLLASRALSGPKIIIVHKVLQPSHDVLLQFEDEPDHLSPKVVRPPFNSLLVSRLSSLYLKEENMKARM